MENRSLKRVHAPAFKARVAIEAIKGDKTLAELTSIYGIHHSMIIKWKQAVLAGLENIFSLMLRRLATRLYHFREVGCVTSHSQIKESLRNRMTGS